MMMMMFNTRREFCRFQDQVLEEQQTVVWLGWLTEARALQVL